MKINNFSDFSEFKLNGLIFDVVPTFNSANLLIGKNGSGKTRFLKSLEKYYKENKLEEDVVTLYFSEIKSEPDMVKDDLMEKEFPKTLYDAIFENVSINFNDFLKLADSDCVLLIEDICSALNIRAPMAKKRAQKDFDDLNDHLSNFFDRVLYKDSVNKNIYMIKKINDNQERKLPLEDAIKEFSPGELMLFYLSIFIFYLEHVKDAKIILILDEPEIHLHPQALVSLMEMLLESKAISQLWVASHSIFIMPLFKFEQLIYFNGNHIKKLNKNTYKDIYDDLIGLKYVDIYELLKSIDNWSYYQFIVENFFLPISKENSKKEDEQVQKIMKCLENLQSVEPIKVLDYGAGKFRLWDCFKLCIPDCEIRNKKLKYEAFEPYPNTTIPDNITFFDNEKKLKELNYDIVVLMNVLHEIDPLKWVETFQTIERILANDGILIFVEVFSLTNGEQPYGDSGYLLLQDPQVKNLFNHAISVHNDSSVIEKSNCWVIPKKDLRNIVFNDIVSVIGSLEKYCEDQLKQLDAERILIAHNSDQVDSVSSVKLSARQYAFLSQQYINAHLAYKRLKTHNQKNFFENGVTPEKIEFPGISKVEKKSSLKITITK